MARTPAVLLRGTSLQLVRNKQHHLNTKQCSRRFAVCLAVGAFFDWLMRAGGWPEDALEVRDGDVVTRGADLGNDRGMAWTTSFSSRLQLFMAEPRGVTITLNGAAIVPISCEELVDMLEEMPLFEDANGLLTQANEGNPPEQKQEQPIDHPFASGRADPAIYASGSGVSVVGTGGSASSGHSGAGAAVGTARASVMKKGRPAMVYHGAVRAHGRTHVAAVSEQTIGSKLATCLAVYLSICSDAWMWYMRMRMQHKKQLLAHRTE